MAMGQQYNAYTHTHSVPDPGFLGRGQATVEQIVQTHDFYRLLTKLWEGNVFSRVCPSGGCPM